MIYFSVWLRNRLISGGLEQVLNHTENLCIALYYIKFSTKIEMYNHKIKTRFLARTFGISGLKKKLFHPRKAVYNLMRKKNITCSGVLILVPLASSTTSPGLRSPWLSMYELDKILATITWPSSSTVTVRPCNKILIVFQSLNYFFSIWQYYKSSYSFNPFLNIS